MKPLKLKSFKHYRYPLKDKEGTYYGEYTIEHGRKPLGFEGEELVEEYVFELNSGLVRVFAR